MLRNHGKSLTGMAVSAITPDHIQAALADQWLKHPVCARRTLALFERIFAYAKSKGYRVGDNPAAWKGCHEYRFPRRPKTARRHFSAMPYAQIPYFLRDLRIKQGRSSSAVALELCILTAARTGEVLGMKWNEVDFENRLWSLPAYRTKQGRAHVVPLSDRALELLRLQRQYSSNAEGSAFVFTGNKRSRLDPKSLLWVLHKVNGAGRQCDTVHGFRSTFRDWAGNETDFAREHIEECLAHQVGNDVERAYRRQSALAKRREILDAWSAYCNSP
jgi:integrase